MAEKAGVTLDAALKNYVAAKQALQQNPVAALAQMADQYVPGGFQAFVAQLTGQPQGQPDPRDAQIAQLTQQVAQLTQGFQQSSQTIEQQRAAQALAERQAVVEQFAAAHPRAQEPEVEAEMIRLLSSGYIAADLPPQDRLSQAYEVVVRLKPAPEPVPAPQSAPAPQTRPEPTSLTGAPSGGSYSTRRGWCRKPILRELFGYPFDQLGLRLVCARHAADNRPVRRIWKALGATEVILPHLRGDHADEAVALLHRDAWRNSKFMR